MPTVKQNIRTQLKSMAVGMTKANGFNIDVCEVNTKDVSIENIKEFPCINILLDDTEILNADESSSDAQHLRKKLNGVFDAYIEKSDDQEDTIDLWEADFEKRFLASYPLGGVPPAPTAYTVEGKALEILLINQIPFNLQDEKKIVGMIIPFSVWYRQDIEDPTVLT